MVKPIHREIRGVMMSMLRMVALVFSEAFWFTALVF